MTLYVDFGLSFGMSVPGGVFIVGSSSQGIIGTNTLGNAASPVFTQINPNHMQSLSVQHKGDRAGGPLITYGARTASFSFADPTGVFDPYVLEQAGITVPGALVRIRKYFNGVTYPVFYGFVDTYEPDPIAPTMGRINVTATDGFVLLNQPLATVDPAIWPDQEVGNRVHDLLTMAAWPASNRAIAYSNSSLQSTTLGASALSLIQDAVKAEVGEFYQRPDGYMVFRNRHAIVTDTRSSTSQATFGSNRAGGEIPYLGRPGSEWDKSQLHTRVEATIEGSSNMQVATDPVAVTRHGTYTLSESGLKLRTDAEALSWANYVLAQDSSPAFRFTAITVTSAIEQLGISVMPHMLGRQFGDRITVVRRPPAVPAGSVVDSRDLHITGISHEWSAGTKQWLTTFELTPATATPFFMVGSSTQGRIGVNRLGW